ncbi:hypothetical protein [Natronorubrum tibetense]|uniref:Uncharacterized protein n=1 Tax=Natronorubrum tibetense GA33 TaxID=1114856 RepID=L9VFF7_9EURY|nr:hypothetical protein [Natronorubrum tibetense]ELY35945.1 hypothetical protein C496_22489 [Natronorubrum tibetense GA33]
MTTDSTGTEVFADVEPDPDAVLAEFGVESPDDLEESGGAHDTVPDDQLDVDDTTAAELFAGLADVETANSASGTDTEPESADLNEPAPDTHDLGFEFVGDSDVTVRDDGDVIESAAAELGELVAGDSSFEDGTDTDDGLEAADTTDAERTAETADSTTKLTVRSEPADELELVGPEPTPTRVTDDAFGGLEADAR